MILRKQPEGLDRRASLISSSDLKKMRKGPEARLAKRSPDPEGLGTSVKRVEEIYLSQHRAK